jgi:hypothetical protein
MPPFVYRSLKDFMRASATAQTRQELLQKLITTAAKRKAQFHVDATDARLVTSPETFGMNLSKQIMNKHANPLRGPAAKSIQMALQKIMGGLKTYGKRMTGNSTLNPMQTRGKLLDELEQQIASSAKPLVDLTPLKQKSKLVQDMLDGVRDRAHGHDPSSSPLGGKYFRDLFEARMRPTLDKIQQHKSLFPGKSTSSTIQSQQQALARARAGAAQVSETARRQQDMATRVGGLEDTLYSQRIDAGKAVNRAREHNQLQNLTFGGGDVPGLGQMGEVVKQKGINRKALEKELDAIESARSYTAGGLAGATLGSVGYNAYANSGNPAMKQSMTMPQPSSRGQTKKVQMPEASPTKPDCDPEGVQMSNNKQAFLTGASIGALGGLATSKPGQRASGIGRGALIGGGTELGTVGGAGFGGLTGTALGALLGGLISRKPEGAMTGAGLGGLTGAVLGAGGGGYAGHIGTKALLDSQQGKDVNPKSRKSDKKDDKEDDKEVKEAAAVVLAQLKRNHNK